MPRVMHLIQGTGVIVIASLVLTACNNAGFNQAEATKVLQSVDVNLDAGGSITGVEGSAVYLDEISGESDSSEDAFAVEDVVDDLPVRVTTQYETEDGSGSSLEDLEGHSGRVAIDVTVENLTLDSSELTYDVVGESRQSPALVGTPLSVAGSVEMEGIRASDVVVDPESNVSTNGVVSQNSEGDAIVQWGTVLAPPQSEATTTFQLVADVDDFSAPEFDIAVQSGFHTDMSFESMVSAAFDTSATSEYGMQQNAIELVADVNDVLTRAGTTITDIRATLDHTTETLGVDAAQQLQQNSDDMVAEMQRVGEQLTALESQVEGSMTGAESAMDSQLSQIVASMSGMMGNTDAAAPQLKQGEGCAATVEDAEANGSLYSTFLVLGAQLEGYAQTNAECRDEVVAEIQNTLGPEEPTLELCEEASSITCTLFNAQVSAQGALDELVAAGKANVNELVERNVTQGAGKHSDEIDQKLENIRGLLDSVENRENQWDALDEAVEEVDAIRDDLGALYAYGEERLGGLEEHTDSMTGQHQDIADQLCETIQGADSTDDLDRDERNINQASEDLVGEPCVDEPAEEPTEEPSEGASEDPTGEPAPEPSDEVSEGTEPPPTSSEPTENNGSATEDDTVEPVSWMSTADEADEELSDESLNGQMRQHLESERAAWESFLEEIGYDAETQEFRDFENALANLECQISELRHGDSDQADACEESNDDQAQDAPGLDKVLQEIDTIIGTTGNDNDNDLMSLHSKLDTSLTELEEDFVEQTEDEFDAFEQEASEQLPENIDKEVRVVTDRVNTARDSVIGSYNSTIAGLAITSDAVVNETSEQIDEQQSTLESQQQDTASALNESTTAVIEGIHQSTATSTRDIEGASAQLDVSLANVILDLGDPDVQGSGILGSMAVSSAMSDTADYQLALASQRAAGYANVRSEDIAEIMLRQAQFAASLDAAASLPAFHLEVPSGAESQTMYAFHIGGGSE